MPSLWQQNKEGEECGDGDLEEDDQMEIRVLFSFVLLTFGCFANGADDIGREDSPGDEPNTYARHPT